MMPRMAITLLTLAESIEFVARELEALRPGDPRLFSSDGRIVEGVFVGTIDHKGKPAAAGGYLRMLAQAAREAQREIDEREQAAKSGQDIAFPPVPTTIVDATRCAECARLGNAACAHSFLR